VAIEDFERRLEMLNARTRVRAARDLAEVVEGLRIVVIRASLFRIRESYILLGCNEIASFLSCPLATHSLEHDYEYASYPDKRSIEISTIAGILTATSPQCCSRDPKILHRSGPDIL
jgi:hypothetical protein